VTVLLAVGVAVVALGAIVLLLFPHRPGGKIAWQGIEVSSIGAGLPLIVLGVAAITIASSGVVGGDGGTTAKHENSSKGSVGRPAAESVCPDAFEGVPAERVSEVPRGAHELPAVGRTASKTEPFGLRFTVADRVVGVMAARLLPGGQLQIKRFVDADCRPTQVEDLRGGGPVESLEGGVNYLIRALPERSYVFSFKYDGAYILIDFQSS
jgi:hypothetical protein